MRTDTKNKQFDYFSLVDEAGKLQPNISRLIAKELSYFVGKRVHIIIKRHSGKRSVQQNALFHLYCQFIADGLGYDLDEMKDILKYKFLRMETIIEATGEVVVFLKKTSKLNKLEFMEFMDNVIKFAAECDIQLPEYESN